VKRATCSLRRSIRDRPQSHSQDSTNYTAVGTDSADHGRLALASHDLAQRLISGESGRLWNCSLCSDQAPSKLLAPEHLLSREVKRRRRNRYELPEPRRRSKKEKECLEQVRHRIAIGFFGSVTLDRGNDPKEHCLFEDAACSGNPILPNSIQPMAFSRPRARGRVAVIIRLGGKKESPNTPIRLSIQIH